MLFEVFFNERNLSLTVAARIQFVNNRFCEANQKSCLGIQVSQKNKAYVGELCEVPLLREHNSAQNLLVHDNEEAYWELIKRKKLKTLKESQTNGIELEDSFDLELKVQVDEG